MGCLSPFFDVASNYLKIQNPSKPHDKKCGFPSSLITTHYR